MRREVERPRSAVPVAMKRGTHHTPPASDRAAGGLAIGALAERLRFVRRARDLGFSLGEVRELLALAAGEGERPCAEVNRIACAHLANVDAKLVQLGALRAELACLVGACNRDAAVGDCSLLSALSDPPGSGAADASAASPDRQRVARCPSRSRASARSAT